MQVVCKEGGWPCEPGDRWPYGMCSLKQLADPGKPEFWSKNAGEWMDASTLQQSLQRRKSNATAVSGSMARAFLRSGTRTHTFPVTDIPAAAAAAAACVVCAAAEGFVSGHANPPAECSGLTLRTCARCASSKDPQQCRQCARNAAQQLSMLESLQTLGPSRADGCGSCYNSTNPAKCVECLVSDAPCALCALQDADTTVDVAACIDCTQKHGDRFKAVCNECASLGAQPQQVEQCMSCLDAMEPLACDSRDFHPGCWNPKVDVSACRTCASRAADFGVCLDCLRSSPYSANCESCAGLEPGKQGACYNCSRAAAHPGSGCADCLQNVADPAQLQQCVGCLTNPKIGAEGKSWCYGCMNWCPDFGGRAQCVACLGTPQDAYMRACACNNG
jgi:hypothetical protein